MHGGHVPSGVDPAQTTEALNAMAHERGERIRRLHRASTWERRILYAIAAIVALGIGVRVVLAVVG